MTKVEQQTLRVGIIDGQAKRLNERIIDDQWTMYLSEQAELVRIPPLAFFKMFGGSIHRWMQRLPDGLTTLAEGLAKLRDQYDLHTLYVNIPMLTPYLFMARNVGHVDLGFLVIAHSVGSEFWLKQWLSIAPFLTPRDVLLSSSTASTQALRNISTVYEQVVSLPLCINVAESDREQHEVDGAASELLSISRIEDVKNIHELLICFAEIRRQLPDVHLTIAGEYTGRDEQQIVTYQTQLQRLVEELQLRTSVTWAGAVEGRAKAELFERATLLLNLSTDPGETFGFNLLEAKTYGVPVVCTNWDGFRDVVHHGVDGWLVDCHWSGERPKLDRQQVVQYGLRILQQAEERQAMQEQAKQRAAEFDHKKIMPQIVQTLETRTSHAFQIGVQDRLRENAIQTALTPIRELADVYRLDHLQGLECMKRSPLDLLRAPSTRTLDEWYPYCKSIIGHFAGRCGDV